MWMSEAGLARGGANPYLGIWDAHDRPPFDSYIGTHSDIDDVLVVDGGQGDAANRVPEFCLELVKGHFVDVVGHRDEQFFVFWKIGEPRRI